jgi:membrane protein
VTRDQRPAPRQPRPERPDRSPWRLGGLSVKALAVRVWTQLWEDAVLDRAAALSYYFLFALFPTLLFLTTLLGMLPVPDLMDRLMGYAAQLLPDDAASLLRKTLAEVIRGATPSLLSVGVLTALWAAANGMASIITALNAAWGVEDPRPWWKRRLLAVGLTVGLSLFVPGALVLLVFGERIGQAVARALGLGSLFALGWSILSWPAVILSVLLGIVMVYYWAPAVDRRFRWVTPGSAFALIAWLAVSYGLKLYVQHLGNYNATYGPIGGVILLLLWLYVSGLVLLVGAEIDSEIEAAMREREAGRPVREAVPGAA